MHCTLYYNGIFLHCVIFGYSYVAFKHLARGGAQIHYGIIVNLRKVFYLDEFRNQK